MEDYKKEQERLRELLEDVLIDEKSMNIQYVDESDENETDQEQFSEHNNVKHKFTQSSHPINHIEVRAFIDLIYPTGITHTNHTNCEDIRKENGYGIEMFCLTMSVQRLKFLLYCIGFDDYKQINCNRSCNF